MNYCCSHFLHTSIPCLLHLASIMFIGVFRDKLFSKLINFLTSKFSSIEWQPWTSSPYSMTTGHIRIRGSLISVTNSFYYFSPNAIMLLPPATMARKAIIVSVKFHMRYLLVILDYHQAQCVYIQSVVFRLKPWKWGLPGMVNYNYNTIAPPHTHMEHKIMVYSHTSSVSNVAKSYHRKYLYAILHVVVRAP